MPKHPNKKAQKYEERERKISSALKDLDEHPDAKLKDVAKHYGLHRNTLSNRVHKKTKPAREAQPANQALTKEEEDELVRWVERRDALGLGPKHRELREMALAIINSRGGPKRTTMGTHFTARLLKRQPTIATTAMKATERSRIVAVTTKGVQDHFKKLYGVIHRYHIDPKDMWNFDEKGFLMGQGGKQNELIIVRVHAKQPKSSRRIVEGSREWVTLIESCSAGGKRLPAYYIYAGTAHYDGWHEGEINPDTAFYYTKNGWTDDQAALHWLKNHFEVHARPSEPGAPRLLLCDNHSSHDTKEFREFCLDHNIHLFFLPGHATHILQPLDVGVFGALDRYCLAGVDDWTAKHSLYAKINKGAFIPICEEARKHGVRSANVKSAWRAVGVHPWSPKTVLESRKAKEFLREQDLQEERAKARASGHPMMLRSQQILSELQKLVLTPEIRDGPPPIQRLATLALEQEAELVIAKKQIHDVLTSHKPVHRSRKILSRARHATRADLLKARHAREYAESGGRTKSGKKKSKQTKEAKEKAVKHPRDEDTIRPCDSEVEREVDELMRLEEEGEVGGSPETTPVPEDNRLGYDEDIIPEAESSAAATRRGPARRCKGGKGGR
jgi:transposase-like protein